MGRKEPCQGGSTVSALISVLGCLAAVLQQARSLELGLQQGGGTQASPAGQIAPLVAHGSPRTKQKPGSCFPPCQLPTPGLEKDPTLEGAAAASESQRQEHNAFISSLPYIGTGLSPMDFLWQEIPPKQSSNELFSFQLLEYSKAHDSS